MAAASRVLLRRHLTATSASVSHHVLRPRAATAAHARVGLAARPLSSPVATSSFALSSSTLPSRRFFSASQRQSNNNNSSNNNKNRPPPPPPPPPSGPKQNIKFWPFLIVIACGSGGYVLLVNRRKNISEDKMHASSPALSPDDVTVVFVLGGPGAGKGTQCARLVDAYGFTHLSAGDLLRAEQSRPGSQFGQLIQDYIRDGLIVPMEVTVKLLENAMMERLAEQAKTAGPGGKKKALFLIDGFPRKMDQALAFEQAVCPAQLVLFYDCPEAEMERRLLERGKTSGRADDNAESIRKRFRTFVETSMPVVDFFAARGQVVKINATATPDAVFSETEKKLKEKLSL